MNTKMALALVAASMLSGCATYSVEPFYDAASKQVLCCRAVVTNSKNIGTLSFFAAETNGIYSVKLVETGVSASDPIAAAAIAASDVAAAVTATAITVGKFAK